MRDLIVVLIFLYGVLMALRRPYFAALLWVWIGLMNPHRLGWGFAYSMPLAMIAAGVLFFSIAINSDKVNWKMSYPIPFLLLIVSWMGLTTLFSFFPEESFTRYIHLLKVLLILLPIAAAIRTREEIIGLVITITGSLAFFGIKGGIFTILTGGGAHVYGPPASPIEDNNGLAVGLIITIPLIYYLTGQIEVIRKLPIIRRIPENLISRFLYLAMFLCLISILGSQSRGALLAMVAMGFTLWRRSNSKLPLALIAGVVGIMAISFMPDNWTNRMHSIQTYEDDTSAMGRINAWTMAINIANDKLTGAGFVTDSPVIYQMYAPKQDLVIVAHSIYFQILGEHGYIGLLLYIIFWISTYSLAGKIIKQTATITNLNWANSLASMAKVSLIGFSVGGAFLSLAYWDLPFYIMVILICTSRLTQENIEDKFENQNATTGSQLINVR